MLVDEAAPLGGTMLLSLSTRRARAEGMCPKRRMHAETRKRYIRGLAAGDGRAEPSFFYLDTHTGGSSSSSSATLARDDHMRKRDTAYREIRRRIWRHRKKEVGTRRRREL